MKKGIKKFRGASLLCSLLIAFLGYTFPYYPSFIFLGGPKLPEILKEDL